MTLEKLIERECPDWKDDEYSPQARYRKHIIAWWGMFAQPERFSLLALRQHKNTFANSTSINSSDIAHSVVVNEIIKEREEEFDAKEQTD